jgi:NADH-quinone oxidoreductase subunit J
MQIVVFYVAGAAAIGSAIAVVVQRNPFLAALSLILHLASLAALYLVLQGDFVAVAQLLVYAGAVMIMFLFVIAYLGDRADLDLRRGGIGAGAAGLAGLAIFIESVIAVSDSQGTLAAPANVVDSFGSPATIGRLFLTDHLLAFEAISLILLVGAIAGAQRARRARAEGRALRPAPRAHAPRGRGRRGKRGGHVSPGIGSWITLSAALFCIGLAGVMLRRNPLVILLSLEIMLNAGNLLLVAGSRYVGGNDGHVLALTVMAVAAAEVVVGLGLIVALARRGAALDVDELRSLHG